MTEQVFYCAIGRSYADLAVMSAASLRRHNRDVHVTVFTDQQVEAGIFDSVETIAAPLDHMALKNAKIDVFQRVRAERALYLDCDTYVAADLSPLFAALDLYDIAVAYDARWTNLSTSGLGGFMNSGVIAFRDGPPIRKLWTGWADEFAADPLLRPYGVVRDQPAFERAIHASGARMLALSPEFNLRISEFVVPISGTVRIFHGISAMRKGYIAELAAFLNSETEARCFFPDSGEMTVREVTPVGDGRTVRIGLRVRRFTRTPAPQRVAASAL